ncbi:Ycf48-like protein [Pseudomonas fluorescens]|nr:Ycf48-like protein [Pseudomonas fluorescens]
MSKSQLAALGLVCSLLSLGVIAADLNVLLPLDKPAESSPRASTGRITDVTTTPDGRVVVVGERGHILYSEGPNLAWNQAVVPVSSDLVAVSFVNERLGWAVGHDGVVLKTTDGGANWEMVLNGRLYGDILVSFYERKLQTAEANERAERALEDAQRIKEEGADKPFLDVYFENERTGWLVGAFNLILKTTDGGETWEPWIDRTENPMAYTFYSIDRVDGELYIAGELGLLLRLDSMTGEFVALESPYEGSFFGLTGARGVLIAFGLRGNAFLSTDKGSNWTRLETGLQNGIVDGEVLQDGRIVLASNDGEIAISNAARTRFQEFSYTRRVPLSGIGQIDNDSMLLVGPKGIHSVTIN